MYEIYIEHQRGGEGEEKEGKREKGREDMIVWEFGF